MLVLLTVAYFFMARKTVLVNTLWRVSKIVKVCSDVLVDFLVVLVRVVNAVTPGSPLERLSFIAVLVGETTLAGAAIGSQRS